MDTDFRDKLIAALRDKGVKEHGQGEWLARNLGVTPKAVSRWLNAETIPRATRWQEIAKALDKPKYYFFPIHLSQKILEDDSNPKFVENDYADIPYYSETYISAGSGCDVNVDHPTDYLSFKKSWLKRMNLVADNLVVVPCVGDSMSPRIREGDIILVDTSKTVAEDGKIFVIDYAGEARVKRLVKKFDGSIIIKSDNNADEYDDELVTKSAIYQLRIIGKAIWVGGLI